jgi:hypothetical protein
MSEKKKPIAIWYFIGLLLTIYGVLVLGASLYDVIAGIERQTVLAEVHIGVWWGILLLVVGLTYVYFFSPNRKKN